LNFGWLQDKRTRQTAQWLPSILGLIATFLGLSNQLGFVIAVMLAVIVALVLWIIFNHILVAGSKTKPATALPQPNPRVILRTGIVTIPRTHHVKSGQDEYILLNVQQGDRLKGHLDEPSNQTFDYYIVDEKNLVYFKKGDLTKFKPLDEGQDDPAYEIDKQIPHQARWYLILDCSGKKTDREVRVDFEEVKRS